MENFLKSPEISLSRWCGNPAGQIYSIGPVSFWGQNQARRKRGGDCPFAQGGQIGPKSALFTTNSQHAIE